MLPGLIKTLSIALSLAGLQGMAQTSPQLPQPIPKSPEAASLAKYINYPVSYSTGLAMIEIPLYTIASGSITLPISLSYHASGLKPNENNSWVGQGWSLQAEPQVTRSVNGREDETGYLTSTPVTGSNTYPLEPGIHHKVSLANGYIEENPDEFNFSLLGKSGTFFFARKPRSNDPYKIVTLPYAPVNIQYNQNNTIWEITDDDGTRYRFGRSFKNAYSIEAPIGGHGTSYRATEIISPITGDTVFFTYYPLVQEMTNNVFDRVEVYDLSDNDDNPYPGCCGKFPVIKNIVGGQANCFTTPSDGTGTLSACGSQSFTDGSLSDIHTIKINEILFRDGKVVFEKSASQTLTSLKIYNKKGLLKSINFVYSNYNTTVAHTRTRLDAIEIRDSAGALIERYSMTYDNTPMPPRFTREIDYWGYYNAQSTSLLVKQAAIQARNGDDYPFPNIEETVTIGGGNRKCNPYAMQAGILTSITYPTGGTTYFGYEGNKYYDKIGAIKYAGGLRIVTIRDYDPQSDKNMVRTFRYGKNETGLGFIKRPPYVEEYTTEQTYTYINSVNGGESGSMRLRTFYSSSLTNMFFDGGAPVVYDQVTEYTEGITSGLGKTVYRYFHLDNAYDTPSKFPGTNIIVDLHRGWERGQLLSKEIFNNTGRRVYKESKAYGIWMSPDKIPIGKTFRKKLLIPSGTALQENIMYYAYEIATGVQYVQSDTTFTTGTYGGTVVKINNYTYNNTVNWQPSITTTTTSDGTQSMVQRKFPHDVTLTGDAETARQQLIASNRITTLLEESKQEGSALMRTKTYYGTFAGRIQPAQVVTNTGPNSADETRILYHSYDDRGNILTVSKANDAPTSYLWGYARSYPIAEVANAHPNQIAYTGFENADDKGNWTYTHAGTTAEYKTGAAAFNGTAVSKTNLPTGNYVISFWVKRKSVATSTVSGAINVTLVKDGWEKHTAILTNVSAVTLNLTNVWLDELRLHPVESIMKTYAYTPLVGIVGSADATNATTVFDYDLAGRLIGVRDTDGNLIKSYQYRQQNP